MLLRSFLSFFLIYSASIYFSVVHAENNDCPRIISQSPYITEMLAYLGMQHCIVGVSRYDTLNLPQTGGILDPDAEAIDLLMPDLMITSDWANEETVKATTPKNTNIIRLKSFNKMVELEENMMTILEATRWQHARSKVSAFKYEWRNKVKQVQGNNKKILLLSSCSGTPYSFGPDSRLYDLFTQAGFEVIETEKRIRHLHPGNEIKDITALLDHYQPDLIFIFEQHLNKQCQMMTPKVPVSIVSFDGALFLQPNVKILKGLDLLLLNKNRWNN